MGGYNRTIATDRGSPIGSRQAWSGNSGGFITTVVNVPPMQPWGRLRWRMASDTSGGNEGWRVDTVNITWCRGVGPPCTPTPTPPFGTPTPPPTPRPSPTPRSRPTPLPRPTSPLSSINSAGVITGYFNDENFVAHGFLRSADGTIIIFDAPSAVNGTFPEGINSAGVVTGFFGDENFLAHGFIRTQNGTITTFDVSEATGGFFFSPASIRREQSSVAYLTKTFPNRGFYGRATAISPRSIFRPLLTARRLSQSIRVR